MSRAFRLTCASCSAVRPSTSSSWSCANCGKGLFVPPAIALSIHPVLVRLILCWRPIPPLGPSRNHVSHFAFAIRPAEASFASQALPLATINSLRCVRKPKVRKGVPSPLQQRLRNQSGLFVVPLRLIARCANKVATCRNTHTQKTQVIKAITSLGLIDLCTCAACQAGSSRLGPGRLEPKWIRI